MQGPTEVNRVDPSYRIVDEGGRPPGSPVTRAPLRHLWVIEYDMRAYGRSDRPVQPYDNRAWRLTNRANARLEEQDGRLAAHVRSGDSDVRLWPVPY